MKRDARQIVESGRSMKNLSPSSALTEKWGSLLEGITDPHARKTMAQLYENQMNYLKERRLEENTTTDNTAPYVKYVFPLLRRVWP